MKGPPAAELNALKHPPIIDLAPTLDNFADAAAVVSELDLVIMTDSAIAHLAGAIATPVWVLLNYGPYWMWGDRKRGSEWYDSVRFFQQSRWGNWMDVIDNCLNKLLELTSSNHKIE